MIITKAYKYFFVFSLLSVFSFADWALAENLPTTQSDQNLDLLPDLPEVVSSLPTSPVNEDADSFIDRVLVSDSENTSDASTGLGSVASAYCIGSYPVTAAQYALFLNAVAVQGDTHHLYDERMTSDETIASIIRSGTLGNYTYSVIQGRENFPITYVDLFSAARFCNWLEHNSPSALTEDQVDEVTETGAYNLSDAGILPAREASARWYLPSEDEWYKAAYYKGGNSNAGYWTYPTQSYLLPGNEAGDLFTGKDYQANYFRGDYAMQGAPYISSVGSFSRSLGAYGTYDMGGNVGEWTTSIIDDEEGSVSYNVRGGSWNTHYDEINETALHSGYREGTDPFTKSNQIGFRVAAAASEDTGTFVEPLPPSSANQVSWLDHYLGLSSEAQWLNGELPSIVRVVVVSGVAGAVAFLTIVAIGAVCGLVVNPITGAALAAAASANTEVNTVTNMGQLVGNRRGLAYVTAMALGLVACIGIGGAVLGLGIGCDIAGPVMVSIEKGIVKTAITNAFATGQAAILGSWEGRNVSQFVDSIYAKSVVPAAPQTPSSH